MIQKEGKKEKKVEGRKNGIVRSLEHKVSFWIYEEYPVR